MWDAKECTPHSKRVRHEVPGVVVVLCERMGEYRVDRVVYPVGDLVSYCKITCLWANCRINFSHIVSSLLAAVSAKRLHSQVFQYGNARAMLRISLTDHFPFELFKPLIAQ